MKRFLFIAGFMAFGSITLGAIYVLAGCGDIWQSDGADTVSDPTPHYRERVAVSITKHWRIFWTDGYERRDATASGTGQNYGWYWSTRRCHPRFDEPYWATQNSGTGDWVQVAHNKVVNVEHDTCTSAPVSETHSYHRHNCSTGGGGEECLGRSLSEKSSAGEPDNNLLPEEPCGNNCGLCQQNGGFCDQGGNCVGGSPSPIVIDTLGNGFDLTNAANGVLFDIDVDSVREQVSWTAADTDDAWLALDRNENGTIDGGKELFGNFTPQPVPAQGEERNGFRALAEYDKPAYGGNNDDRIDAGDAIFAQLKLWQDHNHNGISEQNELQNISDSSIRVIELDYHESRRTDEHGNRFKYRAKVKDAQGAQIGRWAWDVFLVVEP